MNWNKKENKELVEAFLSLDNETEAQKFLRDLMTKTELEEFSNRFQAAKMLTAKIPYSKIEKKTGLSSTTIARVSKFVNGKYKGYQTILNKIHHNAST